MAKVAAWLAIHLLVLAAGFATFVGWQLRLGLDSLLTGATGERLEALGTVISIKLGEADEDKWPAIIASHVSSYGLDGFLRMEHQLGPNFTETKIPRDVLKRAEKDLPPPQNIGGPPPYPPGMGGPRHMMGGPPPEMERGPMRDTNTDTAKALFLTKDEAGSHYWAALDLPIQEGRPGRLQHGILFLKSSDASARGLFFDYRPWLFGGLAVLALSIVFWTPFVLGITRYAGRISRASARIAAGNFDTKIGASRNDELGRAGESIEEMSAKLGHLISGQKRFLGDVAHELCAPLARMRTGLGILQNQVDPAQVQRLESIDEDAGELSALVSELLAFTKANSTPVEIENIELRTLLDDLVSRELQGHAVEIIVPESLSVKADRRLLTRAVSNVLRNCHRHAGETCEVKITGKRLSDAISLTIEDNGPGVLEAELDRLFEPFYRPDKSRTRDTGGTGLGMAIVESSIRACGGKVTALRSEMGGLEVRFSLPGFPASPQPPQPRT